MLQRPGGADQQRDQLGDPDVVAHGTGPLRAMVWTVARGHDLGLEDAADVSQVTWLLLTQHLGSLRQPEELEDWLLRTATREASRMHRLRGHKGSHKRLGENWPASPEDLRPPMSTAGPSCFSPK